MVRYPINSHNKLKKIFQTQFITNLKDHNNVNVINTRSQKANKSLKETKEDEEDLKEVDMKVLENITAT